MLTKFKNNYLILIPILIGLGTLFWGLGTHYQKLVSDEMTFLLNADFLKGYPYYPYLILPLGIGTTHTFLPYLIQFSLNLFGYTVFGLRFVPALYGFLGIIIFYLLLKNISLKNNLALIGAILLAACQWYLAVSRVAIEISEILFYSLITLYFLTCFLNTNTDRVKLKNLHIEKATLYMFLTGLSFGIVQHTYQSARVYLLFFGLFFPLYWFVKKVSLKKITFLVIIFGSGFLITISPLIYAYLNHPESFDSRRGELVFFQNLSLPDLFWSLRQSTIRTLGMFHVQGYSVSCYNVPNRAMLDPISGILMLLGLILSWKSFKKEINLVIYLFFFVSLLPSIISYWPATPHGLRAAGAIIPSILWVSLGLNRLGQAVKKFYWPFVFIIICLIGFLNLKTYFVDQSLLQKDCFRIDVNDFQKEKDRFLNQTGGVKFIR